jgi:hypothetical protein
MDTIEGANGCQTRTAWTLVSTAERVRELENGIGCFDRNPDGSHPLA